MSRMQRRKKIDIARVLLPTNTPPYYRVAEFPWVLVHAPRSTGEGREIFIALSRGLTFDAIGAGSIVDRRWWLLDRDIPTQLYRIQAPRRVLVAKNNIRSFAVDFTLRSVPDEDRYELIKPLSGWMQVPDKELLIMKVERRLSGGTSGVSLRGLDARVV